MRKGKLMKSALLFFISSSVFSFVNAQETRDPAYWPFSSESPWNYPIGSEAQYEDISSPSFTVDGGAGMNSRIWSHPVFIATENDPVRNIYSSNGSLIATQRVPDEAMPDVEADGHLHLIDENHETVVETYATRKLPNGDYETSASAINDLKSDNVFDPWVWHGTRAYGGSAIAGLIRTGELVNGIPHALAVAVRRASMNMNGSDGNPFVWPASSADNGWENSYATSGNMHMGSLLAIPPSVDIKSIGIDTSGPAFEIARALQDYGAYITDAADANIVFYAEPAAAEAGELPDNMYGSLSAIVEHLQVVTNNSEDSKGGGGTPRRPLAPSSFNSTGEITNTASSQSSGISLHSGFNFSVSHANLILRLSEDETLRLQIYRSNGRLLATLMDKKIRAGTHTIRWNRPNSICDVYVVRLKAGNRTLIQRLLLLK
jgi:hypothetical protein